MTKNASITMVAAVAIAAVASLFAAGPVVGGGHQAYAYYGGYYHPWYHHYWYHPWYHHYWYHHWY
jgi:hypothetical protein